MEASTKPMDASLAWINFHGSFHQVHRSRFEASRKYIEHSTEVVEISAEDSIAETAGETNVVIAVQKDVVSFLWLVYRARKTTRRLSYALVMLYVLGVILV